MHSQALLLVYHVYNKPLPNLSNKILMTLLMNQTPQDYFRTRNAIFSDMNHKNLLSSDVHSKPNYERQ